MEDTGFKFSSDKYTNLTDFERSLDYVQIPIFTLVVVKTTGEVVDLVTLFMYFVFLGKKLAVTHLSASDIPGEVGKYKINARDILNIRSEINTANLSGRYKYLNGKQREGYLVNDFADEFFTYLVTILIELDPF